MSILHSIKSGYRYVHWQEQLDDFAKQSLWLSRNSKDKIREVRFMIPKYIKAIGDYGVEEQWFAFNTGWTKEQFKSRFCEIVEALLYNTGFEKEDVEIPIAQVIQDK